NDTVDYSASGSAVTVNLQTGVGSGGAAAGDVFVSIENAIGSAFGDTLIGKNGFDNVLNGAAGVDTLTGGTGNDPFVFHVGESNGDTITDFASVAGNHDHLVFLNFGLVSDGASFVQLDATHWRVSDGGGFFQETIVIANGATINPADVTFGFG